MMIDEGDTIITRRGPFKVIDTRSLVDPFTNKMYEEYIIEDNGVERKVQESDIIRVEPFPIEEKMMHSTRKTRAITQLSKLRNG